MKKQVLEDLKTLHNSWVIALDSDGHAAPDYLLCLNGMFVAIKVQDNKNKIVSHMIARINKCKGIGFEVNQENWHEVFKVLEVLAKEPNVMN